MEYTYRVSEKEAEKNQCLVSRFVLCAIKSAYSFGFPPRRFFFYFSLLYIVVVVIFSSTSSFFFQRRRRWKESTQTQIEYEHDREFIIEIMLIIWFNLRSSYYYFPIPRLCVAGWVWHSVTSNTNHSCTHYASHIETHTAKTLTFSSSSSSS